MRLTRGLGTWAGRSQQTAAGPGCSGTRGNVVWGCAGLPAGRTEMLRVRTHGHAPANAEGERTESSFSRLVLLISNDSFHKS